MADRRETAAQRLREARIRAGYGSAREAAEAFGFTTSTLTSHENNTREYDIATALRYAKAFKVNAGHLLALDQIDPTIAAGPKPTSDQTTLVPWYGKVAAGLWRDPTFGDEQAPVYMEVDKFAGDVASELFTVTPEGPSMNLTIAPGSVLVCRRVAFGLKEATPGDLVIVERRNHDLRELTCKRLAMIDGQFALQSESDRPEFSEPIMIGLPSEELHVDDEITVLGVVLRAVQDLRQKR